MKNQELFLPVRGYEGIYAISDRGRVKSIPRQVNGPSGKVLNLKMKFLKPLIDKDGYCFVVLCRSGSRKHKKIHRLVLAAFCGMLDSDIADHINGDRADNRAANLRRANRQENCQNSFAHADSKSKYKGVSRSGRGWRATIGVRGVTVHLGVFGTEEQAAAAYDQKAAEHYGEFAKLNKKTSGMQRHFAKAGVYLTDPELRRYGVTA